jgi:hypothetical protein
MVDESWQLIAEVEIDVVPLGGHDCRLELSRGEGQDRFRMVWSFDRDPARARVEDVPTVPGTDRQAALVHLHWAMSRESLHIKGVMEAGLLREDEVLLLAELATATRAAVVADIMRTGRALVDEHPSEIVAAAEELGLAPGPSPHRVDVWLARCPGRPHHLALHPAQETFGCGYCRVSGDASALRILVRNRRR